MPDTPLAEWLYEDGIGENRAMLIENGRVKKIRIERDFGPFRGPKYGAISKAKLLKKHRSGGFILLDDGYEAILKKWPAGYSEGQSLNVQIVREAIWERTRIKLAMAQIVIDKDMRKALKLWDEIHQSGIRVRKCLPHESDILSGYGWYGLLEHAEQGQFPFSDGQLIIDQSAAMTVIDIDGDADNLGLSKAAAKACADVIALWDLQGMIGIDFPALEKRADRHLITEIFDEHMTKPCERTSINGFGFMQVVMKSQRSSILSLLSQSPSINAALQILRRAEFEIFQSSKTSTYMQIIAHEKIISLFLQYGWLDILVKRTGLNWEVVQNNQYILSNADIISIEL